MRHLDAGVRLLGGALLPFALGTAAGDLVAEHRDGRYWRSALLFAALIAVVDAAHRARALGAVLASWVGYLLTRPLGAWIRVYLSQQPADRGLGLGTTPTGVLFLVAIVGVVGHLTMTGRDQTPRALLDT